MIDTVEPTLDELLNEPIIRLVMLRDGINIADVRTMMEQAKFRLNRGRSPEGVLQVVHNPCLNIVPTRRPRGDDLQVSLTSSMLTPEKLPVSLS